MLIAGNASLLKYYGGGYEGGGGWIINHVELDNPDTFAVGGTFRIYLDTPISAALLEHWPGEEANEITVGILDYGVAAEPDLNPRDSFPLFCKQIGDDPKAPILINNPQQQIYTIYQGKAQHPNGNWPLIAAEWVVSGGSGGYVVVDLDSRFKTVREGGGWLTKLDLTTYTPVGAYIKLIIWGESADYDAVCTGQARCKWCRADYTNSWGVGAPEGYKYYCSQRAALLALGSTGEAFLALFNWDCYQTGCPMFFEDAADNPLAPLRSALTHDLPWRTSQYREGLAQLKLERSGFSAMRFLAGDNLYVASGYHVLIDYLAIGLLGSWPQLLELASGYQATWGFEWKNENALGQTPNFGDSSSWPDFGPAGNHMTTRLNDAGDVATDTNDPIKALRSMLMAGGVDWGKYSGNVLGEQGVFQRKSLQHRFTPLIQEWFNQPQHFYCGQLTRQWMDANGTVQAERIYSTVYEWLLEYSATGVYSGGGTQVTVDAVVPISGGKLGLWLKHKPESAASISGGNQCDVGSTWMQGGGNVALPPWGRVNNYVARQNHTGPGRHGYVWPGMALRLTSGTFTGTLYDGAMFKVSHAEPCKEGRTASWLPTSNQQIQVFTAPGAWFGQYNTDTEKLTSVVEIYRNGSDGHRLQLTPVPALGGRPHNLQKDEFYYYEGTKDGHTGLWLIFSPANGTADDLDRILYVTAITSGQNYTFSLNIVTAIPAGWNNTQYINFVRQGSDAVGSVEAVVVKTLDGVKHALTAITPKPSTFADWPADKYYVESIAADGAIIELSPEWAGEMVLITVALSATGLTSEEYYTAMVAGMHGASLPLDHHSWANRLDYIEIDDDQQGHLAAWATAHGYDDITGATFDVGWNMVADGSDNALFKGGPAVSDTALDSDHYEAFFGTGKVYIKCDWLATGDCLLAHLQMMDRSEFPRALELNAVTRAFEAIIQGSA
jgi:hypothetical protein